MPNGKAESSVLMARNQDIRIFTQRPDMDLETVYVDGTVIIAFIRSFSGCQLRLLCMTLRLLLEGRI